MKSSLLLFCSIVSVVHFSIFSADRVNVKAVLGKIEELNVVLKKNSDISIQAMEVHFNNIVRKCNKDQNILQYIASEGYKMMSQIPIDPIAHFDIGLNHIERGCHKNVPKPNMSDDLESDIQSYLKQIQEWCKVCEKDRQERNALLGELRAIYRYS